MLNKLTFLLISLLLLPLTAYGLGLGDLTVISRLNEPLKIHIELSGSQAISSDDIIINNSNLNTYKRANLPRPDSLKKARFKIQQKSNGSLVVILTTKRPVREPFITFIADLKWPKGHINREYTFLLDPPEFVQKQVYKKQATKKLSKKTVASKQTNALKTSNKNVSHKKIDYSSVMKSHIDDKTYKVKRADTLWNIAKKVKPNSNVTSYQTMQALFVLNPNAFINNNIDRLKLGQTLKIPTQDEIHQINGQPLQTNSSSQKNKAPAQQSSKQSTIRKQPEKTKSLKKPSLSSSQVSKASDTALNSQDEAQLKIIPPNEELLKTPVTSKEDLILINQALKNSISAIKSLKNENDELNARISALTEQLNSLDAPNQNLDGQLSEISTQLKDQSPSSYQTQKNSASDNNSPDNSSSHIVSRDNTEKPSDNKASTLEINSTIALENTLNSTLENTPNKHQRSFVRELLSNPVITFALTIFTLITLFATLFTIRQQNKKRKNKKHIPFNPYPEDNKNNTTTNQSTGSAQNNKENNNNLPSSSLQGTDISNDKDEEDMDFFEYFEKKINAPESKANNDATQEVEFNLNISDKEIKDYEKSIAKPSSANISLSEIDTYMAYGNYNEAEKCLISEIKRRPSDKNLHLKLFECYTASNQRQKFIKHAKQNINLLNMHMLLRHRVENIFQQTWEEPLSLDKL